MLDVPRWNKKSHIFIKFGIPQTINNLSHSLTVQASNLREFGNPEFYPVLDFNFTPPVAKGIHNLLINIITKIVLKKNDSKIKLNPLIEELNNNLKKFSPIKLIRIMPNLNLKKIDNTYRADYLNFEFFIDDDWLTWNQLSDGTKRLFYIISEVTLNKGVCLIEEPELGTYPEQLDLIMMFLKEQAKEKQIILTTHAPRVLDHLKDEELNRIVITKYEKENGTKMRHLSEEDIQLVIEHRENKGYTSDLWTMTSFFEDEEETI